MSISFRSFLFFGADRTFLWKCVVESCVAEAWRGGNRARNQIFVNEEG